MIDFADNFETSSKRKVFLRLLGYIKPYTFKFILAFFLIVISSAVSMLLPLISGYAIDIMADGAISLDTKVNLVITWGIILLVAMSLSVVIGYVQNMMVQKIGQQITHKIRTQVFDHIETLSTSQINSLPVGKLLTRTTNDPANISAMFTTTIFNLIYSSLSILIVTIIIFIINWQMALVTMILVPAIVIITVVFTKLSKKAHREVRFRTTNINTFLSENLSGIKITQVFNQEEKKKEEFKALNKVWYRSHVREINTFGTYRPLVYLLASLATVLTVYFGVSAVLNNTLSAGLFFSFYVYIGQFFDPIQQISEQFNSLQNGFSSAEKIFDVLDTISEVRDIEDAIELTEFKGHIEFKNVWFAYIDEEWVLKDVSFEVNPNDNVAFVGATGSGKTTILQLIVRNYDINKGQILIDGIDIQTIKRSSLRAHIGQMLQDVFLFAGTVKDNITFRDESKTTEEINEVIGYVGLDRILAKHEGGLNHEVKERGNNFSAGERQLISFARALLYKPSLMILDEATANIDSESEELIQKSLSKMMNLNTMIIVAHRLSTIQHSNKIFVMHKGEIKERGNHQELLKNKGIYYTLYLIQQKK